VRLPLDRSGRVAQIGDGGVVEESGRGQRREPPLHGSRIAARWSWG
jgi:hypothetical protein